jgi:starch synthase (maltosyl-transferring)
MPSHLDQPLALDVDRVRARFGPGMSCSRARGAGLKGVQAQLPKLAELGFDVVYLPPIHPIGH